MSVCQCHGVKMIALAFLLSFCIGCQEEPGKTVLPGLYEMHEALALSNKQLIRLEEQQINDFVERYGWSVHESGTGLRRKMVAEGQGEKASYGRQVAIDYKIYLMTGDKVYDSAEEGPKVFTVGRGGVEGGLEEGILEMRKGAKAYLIMPHHLAHGVPGDGKRIPRRASIVYYVHVLEIY